MPTDTPPPHSPRRPAPAGIAEALVWTALLAVVTLFCCRVIWDIDVFWHIAAGRLFVSDGALPTTDVFSPIDPDRTWVTFQWGYEVAVHLLDELGGLHLVRYAHAALMVGTFALLAHTLRRRIGLGALASVAIWLVMLALFEDRIRVRPHVVNFTAWVFLTPWLIRGPASFDRRAIIAVALTLAVWANMHAGGAFLFLVAAITLPIGALLHGLFDVTSRDLDGAPVPRWRPLRRAATWYAAALTPALLAPHFIRGNWQALTMLDATEDAIPEWRPTWHFLELFQQSVDSGRPVWGFLFAGAVPLLALALVAVASVPPLAGLLRGPEGVRDAFARRPAWRLGLGLAVAVLSLRSVRFSWYSVVALLAVVPLLPGIPPLRLAATATSGRAGLARAVAAAWVALAATAGAAAWQFNITVQHGDVATALDRAFGDSPIDEARFPTVISDFLAGTGFEGGVLCQGNWGGFLLWRLHPGVLVTADGRGNYERQVTLDLATLYDRATHRDPSNGERVRAIYERYAVDAVVHQHPVWPRGYTPPAETWELAFANDKGAVWVRKDTEAGAAYLGRLRTMRAARPPG